MSKPKFRVISEDTESRPADQAADSTTWRTERELDRAAGVARAKPMSMPLGKLAELLLDAAQSNRLWLQDFGDDLVTVDADVFEILMAYDQMRRKDRLEGRDAA